MLYLLRSPYPTHNDTQNPALPALYVAAWWHDRPGHIGHPIANAVKPIFITPAQLARYEKRRPHHHYTVIPVTCPDDLPPDLSPLQINNYHLLEALSNVP